MKILYYGGLNKYIEREDPLYNVKGYGNSMLVQNIEMVKQILKEGKLFAIVTTAKEEGAYYSKLQEMGLLEVEGIEVIEKDSNPEWSKYGGIAILGGDTEILLNWLKSREFNISHLENCELLMGDSAGAYILGGKVMLRDNPQGEGIKFEDGYIQNSNIMVVGHVNNPRYYTESLGDKLTIHCKEHGLELIRLEENELVEAEWSNSEFRISEWGNNQEIN